ncbi:hypothetical protein EP18_10840 [Lysinibacillus sphaericus]|nr:Ger(x)C family spore germination protein [Lysinibacillus sphaericus]KEK11647.1 hypothetical protein EP18_10840 [Lysinibacillus sphaericus]
MNFTNIRSILILFIILAACVLSYIQTTRLNTLSFVSGIGIDKENENYIVSLQIYNPEANKKDGSDEMGGYTYSAKGETIPEAIKKIETDISKTIFIETLEVVALGENILREDGLEPLLDYLIQSLKIPANIRMIVIKGVTPELFFQLFIPDQSLTSIYVNNMLTTFKNKWGSFADISAERIKSLIEDHTTDFVLPYVEVKGDIEEGLAKSNIEQFKPNTSLSLTGIAIFNKDKLQSYLTYDESNLFALLRGVNQKISMTLPCSNDEKYLTLQTIKTTSSIDSNTSPVSFDFKIHIKGNLEGINCKKDLTKPRTIKEIEALIEIKISEEINGFIKKHYPSKSEFLGLKDALYRQHPKYYKKNKMMLNSVLSDAQINVDVKVSLDKVGPIGKV